MYIGVDNLYSTIPIVYMNSQGVWSRDYMMYMVLAALPDVVYMYATLRIVVEQDNQLSFIVVSHSVSITSPVTGQVIIPQLLA